ncbi:hypothetical protein LIER_42241 [Lithospermum erythrorhizon]|uniref:Uncharacterized protein n=1 Tax=Lithospermum erythrorhizon TaxID=34254 RepID=A0AAV3RQ23_LITER
MKISFGLNFSKVKLIIQCGDHSFVYNRKNFLENFGLESRGFNAYADKKWPDELPPFLDVSLDLNNHSEFPLDVEKDHTIPQFQLFHGEDKFATNCLGRAIIPTGTQDRRVPKTTSSLLYNFKNRLQINFPVIIDSHMNYVMFNAKATTLPYGMLISHIMRKWKIIPSGPSLGRTVLIGKSSIRNQNMVCYNGRLLCEWEIEEASPEDCVQIDLIRGVGSSSGNVSENDETDDAEIRKRILSIESSEAQKYLAHSDSDPEGDERQTVSGTPVHAEDYGFHHTSSGDGDGGKGFFSDPQDGA